MGTENIILFRDPNSLVAVEFTGNGGEISPHFVATKVHFQRAKKLQFWWQKMGSILPPAAVNSIATLQNCDSHGYPDIKQHDVVCFCGLKRYFLLKFFFTLCDI